jgi:hypothetical protein
MVHTMVEIRRKQRKRSTFGMGGGRRKTKERKKEGEKEGPKKNKKTS